MKGGFSDFQPFINQAASNALAQQRPCVAGWGLLFDAQRRRRRRCEETQVLPVVISCWQPRLPDSQLPKHALLIGQIFLFLNLFFPELNQKT